ncbi:MAG: hypothetical protein LBK60_01515 [Verrucomicrobiales bacterium]|jgi:hypothetical protein|nr:hypothetical protein [Verrucomicrobiales bacterium]
MRFFADELLEVGAAPVGCTPARIDHCGGARATKALIQVRGALVHYSFIGAPTVNRSLSCGAGGVIEIDGYDNLNQVRFATLGGGLAFLYLTYGN